jgi:class 3 adenylate cyclase
MAADRGGARRGARPSSRRARGVSRGGCAGDANLRDEIRGLLAASDKPGAVDRPIAEMLRTLASAEENRSNALTAVPARRTVSHYEILHPLASGGMGVVYKARDTVLRRAVALKFLPASSAVDPGAKARFLVEARSAAALDHRNICTIHEIAETDDGQPYIVMPLYEGETLATRLGRGPLAVSDAIEVATQVAHGLAHAHERGLVHRDIKPANLIITAEGVVKILDFGIVKHKNLSLTGTGATLGTLRYMSPEQLRGEPVDARTDVWSLGVVCYEMVTGRHPFQGDDDQNIREAIFFRQPLSALARNPDVPDGLSHGIAKAMAKDREERYSSAEAFLAALEGEGSQGTRHAVVARPHASSNAPPPAQVLPGGERREASVVSASLAGYARLVERFPAQQVEKIIRRLRVDVTEIVERHGGTINEFGPDRMVILFGIPASHEDHCQRAVRAALEIRERIRAEARESLPNVRDLALHAAIDIGPVAVQSSGDAGGYRVAGRPLQRASRLCSNARDDGILVTPDCERVIRPFFDLARCESMAYGELGELLEAHRVVRESDTQDRLDATQPTRVTRYTGRDAELSVLRQSLDAARCGEGRLVTVTGEAGMGKSRLLLELRREIHPADVTVLVGRCTSYGSNTAYLPFLDAMRQALG